MKLKTLYGSGGLALVVLLVVGGVTLFWHHWNSQLPEVKPLPPQMKAQQQAQRLQAMLTYVARWYDHFQFDNQGYSLLHEMPGARDTSKPEYYLCSYLEYALPRLKIIAESKQDERRWQECYRSVSSPTETLAQWAREVEKYRQIFDLACRTSKDSEQLFAEPLSKETPEDIEIHAWSAFNEILEGLRLELGPK